MGDVLTSYAYGVRTLALEPPQLAEVIMIVTTSVRDGAPCGCREVHDDMRKARGRGKAKHKTFASSTNLTEVNTLSILPPRSFDDEVIHSAVDDSVLVHLVLFKLPGANFTVHEN